MLWAEHFQHRSIQVIIHNVPARLGKGQGAKEIGHKIGREQPKSAQGAYKYGRAQASTGRARHPHKYA